MSNNRTAPADQSTCGDGSSTCNVAGNTPARNAKTIFITPALAFTVPFLRSVRCAAMVVDPTSIASP